MSKKELIENIVYSCLSWEGLEIKNATKEEIVEDILNYLEKLNYIKIEEK